MKQHKRRHVSNLDYQFFTSTDLGRRPLNFEQEFAAPRSFHSVGYIFALHSFFASAECLDNFLHNVSSSLCDGGFFFGTVPLAPVCIFSSVFSLRDVQKICDI